MAFALEIKGILQINFQQVKLFEQQDLQDAALKLLPLQSLSQAASQQLSHINEGLDGAEKPLDFQDCLVIELLSWFKNHFFAWFNEGWCEQCHTKMKGIGYTPATSEEKVFGGNRVEAYSCEICGSQYRFPRYFHPGKLLETRKGRCMEWASCFTLFCRALKIDARYVWDRTDHVWTEIYSLSQERWMHTDSCENKFDSPLLYEAGWGKKLSYIFAFSNDEVVDVALRYTCQPLELCNRRKSCREDWLAAIISELNKERQRGFSSIRKSLIERRLVREIGTFFAPPRELKQGESEGRFSGSLGWRFSRGETTDQDGDSPAFLFSPSPEEIHMKEMFVKYSLSKDEYVINNNNNNIKGWKAATYKARNVFRKDEKDWKMVYLARRDGDLDGEVCWRFDWSKSNLIVQYILVVFQHCTFESGNVLWNVSCGGVCHSGDQRGVIEISSELNGEIKHFEIAATLQGGTGDVKWQHAQLFRQREGDIKFPFFVHIKFK